MHVADQQPSGLAQIEKAEIAVPLEPPQLNAGGSRALLRVLLRAARAQADSSVRLEANAEALAS
jgi:hypothetical protein